MTVDENRNPRVQYNGPIEINDELAITFPYAEKEDVACQLNEELLRYSIDYTILGQTLTIKVAAGQADTVTIYRTTPLDQQAEFPQNNRFNSAKLNESLDKICMQQQEQSEMINRCTKVPITFMNFDGAIPYPQANKALKINSEATGFTLSDYDPDEAIVVTEQYKSEAVVARDEAIKQQQEATNQANLAKEWATSETMVQGIDYSSKYYAQKSEEQAQIATDKTTEVVASGNTALTNIENAESAALTAISNQQQTSVSAVNATGATQIALATEQANIATEQATIATEQATIATNKASEVVESGNEVLGNIDTAKSEALTEIETLHSSSVTDITNLKNTSVSDITAAKNNAITSITNQETTSKTSLINEGATQVGLIQNEGATQVANVQSTGFYMRNDKLYFINSQGEETEFKSGGGSGLEVMYDKDNKAIKFIDSTNTVEFTINPDPSDATVVITSGTCEQVGNSITVPKNSLVEYTVSKDGMVTKSGHINVVEDSSINVKLTLPPVNLTINNTKDNATTLTYNDGNEENKTSSLGSKESITINVVPNTIIKATDSYGTYFIIANTTGSINYTPYYPGGGGGRVRTYIGVGVSTIESSDNITFTYNYYDSDFGTTEKGSITGSGSVSKHTNNSGQTTTPFKLTTTSSTRKYTFEYAPTPTESYNFTGMFALIDTNGVGSVVNETNQGAGGGTIPDPS